jgi:hypothetical protein
VIIKEKLHFAAPGAGLKATLKEYSGSSQGQIKLPAKSFDRALGILPPSIAIPAVVTDWTRQ